MESNYVYAKEIENFVNKRLRRLDPQLERVSYSATPQGFVNSEQAWRVLEELIRYMDEVRAGGLPMSAGIITLNRPQRQLIHLLVGAAKTRLGLVDAHNHAFVRPEGEAHVRDQPLFIQSIDQIQGEEREIILLSMLLAPRRQAFLRGFHSVVGEPRIKGFDVNELNLMLTGTEELDVHEFSKGVRVPYCTVCCMCVCVVRLSCD